eukprot:CAMPEP_0171453332 /NCGR_PEP_ID=MMETSP0945-20130129/1083_1 /TAXON_ID=109269 /ORGANISM="Vaucheria litorea, Strain CCMP2940" /LENGTH=148 /DNA_ID=CAMNT_0011978179 /DNA_START=277 /DNA_END=720 /DNA_ORIENTATION=+
MVAIRRKEDPWNAIASGFATGGILALRAGPKIAAQNAVVGGVLLAIIEGLMIATNKYFAKVNYDATMLEQQQQMQQNEIGPKNPELAPPISAPSFLSRLGIGEDQGSAVAPSASEDVRLRDDSLMTDTFANNGYADSQVQDSSSKSGW